MSIREKLISFIYKSATRTKKIRTLLAPIGAIFFILFTTFFVLVSIEMDKLLNLNKFFPENYVFYFSIPLAVIGILLTFWSIFHFLLAKGTPVPLNPPPVLIKSGPYKYTRNPMLTGVFLILLGLGIGLNSFSLIFLLVPLFIGISYWELKNIEEPELIKRLGRDYSEYRDKTPMFIPGLKSNKNKSSQ